MKKLILSFILLSVLFLPTISSAAGLIPCGGDGEGMCRLCHLILGINGVIKYLRNIAIFVALAVITGGGVMYVVSAGNEDMMKKAKSAIYMAMTGFALTFLAWLIVNMTIFYLGTKSDLGVGIVSWNKFQCN